LCPDRYKTPLQINPFLCWFLVWRKRKIIILFADYCLVNPKTLGNNASPVAIVFFIAQLYLKRLVRRFMH